MRRSSHWSDPVGQRPRDDAGSAALEFIVAGLVLLVPLVYLVVALGMIQGQALGAETAARHAARAVSTASGPEQADTRMHAVVVAIAGDYGIDPARMNAELSCLGSPPECPAAGATIAVTVRVVVPLPLVPPVLGLDRVAAVPVEAAAAQKMSRVWGGG